MNKITNKGNGGSVSVLVILLLFIVAIYLAFFQFDIKKAFHYTVDQDTRTVDANINLNR